MSGVDRASVASEVIPGESSAKGRAAARKIVVAAAAPWSGELYGTRPGRRRFPFNDVETFCGALLAATDWPIGTGPPGVDRFADSGSAPSGPRNVTEKRPGHPLRSASAAGKFIVSAHAPWTGELYRTRAGLGRFAFDTFEGFFGAMLDVTGWTLDHDPSSGTTP